MKRIIALLLAAVMMISMVACGNTGSGEEAKEPETVGEFLRQDFVGNSEGSAQEVVDRLIQNEILPFEAATMPVDPAKCLGVS